MSRRAWSTEDDVLLVANYADAETRELALELGRSVGAVYARARILGLLKSPDYIRAQASHLRDAGGKRWWTADEDEVLRELYADVPSKTLAQKLNRSLVSVYGRAKTLGLQKSATFHTSALSGRMKPGECRSPATQFQKGHVPKYISRNVSHIERWQFRPGQMPPTWVPVGTEIWRQGYLWRKVRDDQRGSRARFNWRQVHLLIWEAAHGAVPAKHCVTFKNKDPRDLRLENLECVSKAEVRNRNSIHQLPEELRDLIRLKSRVTRRINDRMKKEAANAQQD